MKDAKGHGSNPRGIASVRHKVKDPTWTGTVIAHGSKPVVSGGQPKSSNAQAAEALASALKSTQAPVHDAMNKQGDMAQFVADMKTAHASGAKFKSKDDIDPSSGRLLRRHR